MKKLKDCKYTVSDGVLTVTNGCFSHSLSDIISADACVEDNNGLSMPFLHITAQTASGAERELCLWDDLPTVYFPCFRENRLLTLTGDHWSVRTVKLHAFTDENDTLTEENEYHLFKHKLTGSRKGDIFFLEDAQSGNAVVIVSETPDYRTSTITVRAGVVAVENGGNGLALGFCRVGECESLCREYYRHARRSEGLVTMSNTWGDRNGFKRVCEEFILQEIDAARDMGVDIVQIDDGWQSGSTADPTRRDELDRRTFLGDFWELDQAKFPNGMRAVTDYAAQYGIKIGLWFAPDSHDCFALLERDKAVLRRAYAEWGIRFFKLDMFWISSSEEQSKFLELLREIYSFGDDVAVQLDVTRDQRMNYLCGRQYGTVFVENRYHRGATSYPHRILRNLWMLGRYLPTNKFQFEMINPDLYVDDYPADDPFAPSLYGQDYLFASVMLCNPLFWQEMQFLSAARREELKPIMDIWKQHRSELANADVLPIGQKPSGRSFTGFCVTVNGTPKYLLLFREATDEATAVINAPISEGETKVLISNSDAQIKLSNGTVHVSLSKQRAYAWVML